VVDVDVDSEAPVATTDGDDEVCDDEDPSEPHADTPTTHANNKEYFRGTEHRLCIGAP